MRSFKKTITCLLAISFFFCALVSTAAQEAVVDSLETTATVQENVAGDNMANTAKSDGIINLDDMPTGYISDKRIAIPILTDGWTPPELLNSPSSYDLRNVDGNSYVTSVKNQNPYGTCWSFAFCAAAESNLLKKGLGYYDLSELQLVYYTFVRDEATAAAGGGTAGDIVTDNEDLLEHGGNSYFAMEAVSNWLGLANESELTYQTENFSKVVSRSLDTDYAYSKDSIHVQNVYAVSLNDRAIIKSLLQTCGAATISYCHIDGYYNSNRTAFYQNAYPSSTNHAVTLIGWDDNYAISNFNSSCQPSSPGAWLCKNSWGPYWNNDGGYFYISYEDASFSDNPYTSQNDPGQVYFVDCNKIGDYGRIYQYDGGIGTGFYGFSNTSYAANVFTAEANENIAAVSFYTTDAVNTDITISVYTGVSTTPSSGIKVLEQSFSAPYSESYYTVPLNDKVPVAAGSKFAVEIRYTCAGPAYVPYDYTLGYGEIQGNADITSRTVSHAGESYMSTNGSSWIDVSTSRGNLRIKAKTEAATVSTMSGDVNCDYAVSVRDAVLIIRHITGLGLLSAGNQQLADVNKDGVISVSDVVCLCRYVAGSITSLP